jgi:NADH:ubiquinone oxidoreductase subunit 6 (subunit J)
MRKSTLFLVLAAGAGMLCGLAVMISKNYVWAARLLIFPSLVGSLVFLAMYAKSSRQR